MPRPHLVFARFLDAVAFRDAVDDALNLPHGPGTSVGGGIHAPPDETWTLTYQLLLEHSNGDRWAYPFNDESEATLRQTGIAVPDNAVRMELERDEWREVAPSLARLPERIRPIYQQRFARAIQRGPDVDLDLANDTGRGIITIGGQAQEALVEYFTEHPAEMRTMHPRRFEELIAEVFERFGYVVELTKATRDGGCDIIALRAAETRTKCIIECKRWAPHKPVGIDIVQRLYGVRDHLGASVAVLATTARFTRDAKLFFEQHEHQIQGRDYDGILDWLKRAT